eukprot:655572_1
MCADSTNTMVIVPNLRFLGFICVIVSIASGSLPGPLASNDLGAAFSQSIDRSTFRKSKDRYTSTVHSNLLTVDPTLHEHFDKYQFTVPSALYDNVDRYSLHVKPKLHQSTYRYLSTVYSFNRIHYGDSDSHYKCLYESSECSSLVQHTSHYPINLARLQSHILWICFSGFMFFMIRTRLSLTKPTNPSTNIAQNARNITPYLPLIIYHLFMISTPHLVVSTVISPQQKLTAVYNPTDNDRFAWGLDVYGDYALIGAYGDNPKGTQSGSVYVFQQHDDQWNVTQRLFPDDGGYMDNFGRTVCVYDSYAFIAAPYDNDMGSDSGSVYIYSNVDDIWTQSVKLTPDDLTDNAFFGWDIAMYHDYALIGAPSWWGSSPKGSAYFYQKVNDSWTFVMKVSPDTPVTAGFGVSVAMWDDHAIIGAYEDTDDSGNITVSAYVYQKVNDIWSQTAKLIPSDGTSGEDMNGLPVSIYANYAVIGASYSNSIYIFENVNGVWTETQSISGESSGDKFGRDVVMYGQYILVGAEAANDGKGKGYAFKNINGTWSLWDTFIAADGTFSDRFAYSISVYNNVVFFGAHKKNNYQGAAYFTALNPHYSYCDFYSPAIKPETENTVASNLHVYEVMEISFDLTVHNNWTCPHTVCHLFQIGTSLYDSYPRLPLLGMPDATEGVLFHVPYSDALDRNTKINYDEDTYYNIIYDGNTHSVYFRFSGTQRIFAVDGEVVRQTNGEYNSSQYYGDGYGLFVTNTGSPSYVPDVTMTDFCVYSDTEAPTKSPSPAPSSAPSHSTNHPSLAPSSAPTNAPSLVPSSAPTIPPSNAPSFAPSIAPSDSPSFAPSIAPSMSPSIAPTNAPSFAPSIAPSFAPSIAPTNVPSAVPTLSPTTPPSNAPSVNPTISPTLAPTSSPTTCWEFETNRLFSDDGQNEESIAHKLSQLQFVNPVLNTSKLVHASSFYKQTVHYTHDDVQQLMCDEMISCLNTNIYFDDNAICNVRCSGSHSCVAANIFMTNCDAAHILCNGSNACSELYVEVESDAFMIECGVATSCNFIHINITGNNKKGNISCIDFGSCDGAQIFVDPANYQNVQLQMTSYSENVTFSNGFGYQDVNQSVPYVDCNAREQYVRYNNTALPDNHVESLVLNEYKNGVFPCDGVTIICFEDNDTSQASECDIQFTAHSLTPNGSAPCYW